MFKDEFSKDLSTQASFFLIIGNIEKKFELCDQKTQLREHGLYPPINTPPMELKLATVTLSIA